MYLYMGALSEKWPTIIMLDKSINVTTGLSCLSEQVRGAELSPWLLGVVRSSLSSSVIATSVDHPLLRHMTPGSRNARSSTDEQVLELNYSSNGARLPADLRVGQRSAGQCSIRDN